MRSLLYVMSAMVVIALAFWAYHENYKTQEAQATTRELQRKIIQTQARLGMLRAEWAYLNRPNRLRDLAEMNFDRLRLLPLEPQQFGRVDEVSYPTEKKIKIDGSVDVSSDGGDE